MKSKPESKAVVRPDDKASKKGLGESHGRKSIVSNTSETPSRPPASFTSSDGSTVKPTGGGATGSTGQSGTGK